MPAIQKTNHVIIRRFIALLLTHLAVLIFANNLIIAQYPENHYLRLNKAYVLSGFNDAGDIATSPKRWDNKQWFGLAAIAGATILVYSQDADIHHFFQRNRSDQADRIMKNCFAPLGSYYLAGILGGMYIYGLAAKNPESETAALLAGKAVVLTGAYTFLFKNIFQRKRPCLVNFSDPDYWGGPFDGFRYDAFPSGHTSVAFAAATVISAYYSNKTWVGITAFSFAGLVAISRIYDNIHWASDVVAGAALGYAIGRLVYNNHKKRKLNIQPFGSIHGSGLTFRMAF